MAVVVEITKIKYWLTGEVQIVKFTETISTIKVKKMFILFVERVVSFT